VIALKRGWRNLSRTTYTDDMVLTVATAVVLLERRITGKYRPEIERM
jgi:hypothetical protein